MTDQSFREVLLELVRRKRPPMWLAAPLTYLMGLVVLVYGFATHAMLVPYVLGLALLLLAHTGPGITQFSLEWADGKFEASKDNPPRRGDDRP